MRQASFLHAPQAKYFVFIYTCHLRRQSNPPWFGSPDSILWEVRIRKLLILMFYPAFWTVKLATLRKTRRLAHARCEGWLLDAFAKLRKSTITVVMSIRLSVLLSAWNSSAPSERIFIKSDIWVFFENLSRNFKFHWDLTRIIGTLHEDQYTLYMAHFFLEWEMSQKNL